MTKDEALKLALEALKHTHPSPLTSFYTIGDRDKAIKAIKEHLAQPEQEPVAKVVSTAPERIWLDLGFDPSDEDEISFDDLIDATTWSHDNATGYGIEYVRADTTPPHRKPLTDEEIDELWNETVKYAPSEVRIKDFARAIEAAHGIKENT